MSSRKRLVVLLVLVLALVVTGCKSQPKNKEIEEELTEQVKEEKKEKLVKEYEAALATANKELPSYVKFVDKHIAEADKDMSNRMMLDLEDKLKVSSNRVRNNVVKLDKDKEILGLGAKDIFFPESKIGSLKNKDLKDYVGKLYKSYYKIMYYQDDIYLVVDYDKLLRNDKYMSEDLISYMSLKADQINNPVIIDGELKISYSELRDRLIKTEEHLLDFEDLSSSEDVLMFYRDTLIIYLRGTDKTPIYEGEEELKDGVKIYGSLRPDLLRSFEDTAAKKDKVTAHIVGKYLEYLRENQLKVSSETEVEILSLVNEATNILESEKGN